MAIKHLDRMTWPDIKAEMENGCTTVIVCFGSHEQHGRHLPLGTDAFFGDRIGEGLAKRLDAFLAPVYRVGCSQHHMGFPGTITLTSETFGKLVCDTAQSLSQHGFEKILLIPTHGGNFKPLEDAVKNMGAIEGCEVLTFTDLNGLIERMYQSSGERGISKGQAGIHAGEWETSLMLSLKPEMVKMNETIAGYTGDFRAIKDRIFDGLHLIDKNGVLGDPTLANGSRGRSYLDDVVDYIFENLN
jgi:creatinine amidohydrolase